MESIQSILQDAAKAVRSIKLLTEADKKTVLLAFASQLRRNKDQIIAQNKLDLVVMPYDDPKMDRLVLNVERIEDLAKSIEEIVELEDPSNQVLTEKTLANGLFVQKKTVALGVVAVIYESRPNVTIDVATLCIRSGNVCLLKGGTDALHSNRYLVDIMQGVLETYGFNKNIVQLLPADRKYISELLTATKYVDVIIPRGSQQLINYVRENAKVPVIETGAGVCHTYVESTANLVHAADIVTNAKVTRSSACNALDTVLVDASIAKDFLSLLSPKLRDYNVEIFADATAYKYLQKLEYPYLQKTTEEDFGREFLDFKCSIKVLNGLDEALDHIAHFSSKHSEAIVSEDAQSIERFLNEVDASAVYANASTRFTDGGVFGLGAEIGISTQKLHARGPFALEKLITEKWVINGAGQVR